MQLAKNNNDHQLSHAKDASLTCMSSLEDTEIKNKKPARFVKKKSTRETFT